jgi:hypothetical protein
MKTITFQRQVKPEGPAFGDYVTIEENGAKLFECSCSTSPNPYRPKDRAPWPAAYALVAPGMYHAGFTLHEKFGLCLMLNDGGQVPTINANVNQGGRCYATEVFIHKGDSETWRGSMACFTIPPRCYSDFMSHFAPQEVVKIILEDNTI